MASLIRVLLVDDDDLFYDLISWVVQNDSLLAGRVDLTRLADGEDALDYFSTRDPDDDELEHPWPNLLLLDQRMPRLDGTEVLRQLRASHTTRALPICMLSSSNQGKLVREAYDLGANFYFVKPLALEDLQLKVRKIVEFMSDVAELPPIPAAAGLRSLLASEP